MQEENISEMWKQFNERLDALSIDDFDFLVSQEFRGIICLRHKFDWSGSGHPDVYPKLELPVCEVLEQYGAQHNTVMYLAQISHLIAHFPDLKEAKVLEMGGGFGGFCRVLHSCADIKTYTILDTPTMTRFAEKYLTHHGLTVKHETNHKKLKRNKFDLFVSNICISETPQEYRQWIVDNLWPRCQRCFVIDGDGKNPEFNEWLEKSVRDNFKKVQVLPISTPWKCKLYIGEK